MPASRIDSIDLNADGSVTIHGTFTDTDDYNVTLLHIWLAQQGVDEEPGVGLATDALDTDNTFGPRGEPAFDDTTHSFSVKSFGAAYSVGSGAGNAPFRPGPAVVSAIAVVSPKPPSVDPPAVVLEWSRMLTLPALGKTEAGEDIPQ
jgi:hypothetical protein